MNITFQELDAALQSDISEDKSGFEFHEIALDDGGDVHVVFHRGLNRAGLVYVGNGSNGLTSWTDAISVEDAVVRWLNDDMSN